MDVQEKSKEPLLKLNFPFSISCTACLTLMVYLPLSSLHIATVSFYHL